MTITAKFSGTCTECGVSFAAGSQINWERARGAWHVECPTPATVPNTLTKIQYMTGCGMMGACYADCGNRIDEFLAEAAAYNKTTVAQVREKLLRGESVAYSYEMDIGHYDLRDGAIVEALTKINRAKSDAVRAQHNATNPRMRCRSCGATGNRGAYPFSTNPSSGRCDDCC